MEFQMSELCYFRPLLFVIALTSPLSSRSLKDGDIVNIDVTVYLDGFHGDTSRTFLVGNVVSDILSTRPREPSNNFAPIGQRRPKASDSN